jgi:hypothetical protein
LRLDPFDLPARFVASDAVADERVRHVELHRERVVVRRSLAGMPIALNMPVKAFAGIAIKLSPEKDAVPDTITVFLAHKDHALALPLYISSETEDALAEWRIWGSVLGLPLLIVEDDGELHEPFARIGGIRVEQPRPRRRRRSPLRKRRPSILMWRKAGGITEGSAVHRGEREIIARN